MCVENTFRSVMSEALFNARAPPGWHAESAGVSAAATVNPSAVELMREIGIDVGRKVPRTVTSDLVGRADRVVTFGCLDRCPIGAAGKAEDWPIEGATGKEWPELRAIRDELRRRVEDLIERIDRGRFAERAERS